jgi:hypothetical protein
MATVLLNRSEIDLISSRSMRMAISWSPLGGASPAVVSSLREPASAATEGCASLSAFSFPPDAGISRS